MKHCNDCGAENKDGARFCCKCGIDFEDGSGGGAAMAAICVVALLVAIGFGVYFGVKALGSEGPHNYTYQGEVVDEVELYGNVLLGYATNRGGVVGWLEKNAHGLLKPGPNDRLYRLRLTKVEYDTTEWFKTTHHVEDLAVDKVPKELRDTFNELCLALDIFVHEESDIADKGWTFTATPETFGRLRKRHLLRDKGVEYTYKDAKGEKQTIELHLIHTDARLVFKPSK